MPSSLGIIWILVFLSIADAVQWHSFLGCGPEDQQKVCWTTETCGEDGVATTGTSLIPANDTAQCSIGVTARWFLANETVEVNIWANAASVMLNIGQKFMICTQDTINATKSREDVRIFSVYHHNITFCRAYFAVAANNFTLTAGVMNETDNEWIEKTEYASSDGIAAKLENIQPRCNVSEVFVDPERGFPSFKEPSLTINGHLEVECVRDGDVLLKVRNQDTNKIKDLRCNACESGNGWKVTIDEDSSNCDYAPVRCEPAESEAEDEDVHLLRATIAMSILCVILLPIAIFVHLKYNRKDGGLWKGEGGVRWWFVRKKPVAPAAKSLLLTPNPSKLEPTSNATSSPTSKTKTEPMSTPSGN